MGVQPKDFRYVLKYENKEHELVFAPMGWETDTKVNFSRDKDYFGVFRKFSLPLQFTYDGRDILYAAYAKYGVEAEVEIVIDLLDKRTWQYKPFFTGDIDFSTYEYTGDMVSVALMESGISKNIKANEGITYEYPLTGDDVVNVVLPGIVFTDEVQWAVLPSNDTNLNAAKKYIAPLDLTKQSESGFIEGFNVAQRNAADTDNFSGDIFIKGNRPDTQKITVKGRIKGNYMKMGVVTAPDRVLYLVMRTTNGNATVRTLAIADTATMPLGPNPFEINFEFDYMLASGEGLYIYSRTDVTASVHYISIEEGEMSAGIKSVSDPSICKGIRSSDLFRRIINKISPGTQVSSNRLSTYWKDLIFTSGDGIREIPDAKIKISWKDFFQTFKGLDDMGFGIENGVAVMELAQDFARPVTLFDVGEAAECSISVANEYMFNSVKVGYKDGNTDEQNGKEEYNSGQEWAMPISRMNTVRDWVSVARADQYGIEKIRVDYNIKSKCSTKDTSSDNDTFMMDCYRDGEGYRLILGSSYEHVENISSWQTAYNLRLTPKKNLLRHGAYLAGMLDKLNGRWINFASADKNAELITVKDGIRVKENENIQVSSLESGYFLPEIATIKALLPKNAVQKIGPAPYGQVAFSFKGKKYRGYILDMDVDVAKNANHELKLLLCSN